jgi:hypothetical protein
MLNHVVVDKMFHKQHANGARSLAYDAYKSGLLLCHYKELTNALNNSITGPIVPHNWNDLTNLKTQTRAYSSLVLIMCYVRYVCDENSVASVLKKTGELLGAYTCLLRGLTAIRDKLTNDVNYRSNGNLDPIKKEVNALFRHATEAHASLLKYNTEVTHTAVDDKMTVELLLFVSIPARIRELNTLYNVIIPDYWITKLTPSSLPTFTASATMTTTTNATIPIPSNASDLMETMKREFAIIVSLESVTVLDPEWETKASRCRLSIDKTQMESFRIEELERRKKYLGQLLETYAKSLSTKDDDGVID